MSNLEDEIRDLREKNNELVQKVQYWKMTAAQREDEKLALMKEINELRLKLSSVKNSSKMQSKKIEATIQAGNEKALAFLVRASSEIANIMEATKSYFTNMQQLDTISPRWSAIGGSPSLEKPERVHRVPPTLVGGRSIQPVVSLSRTLINSSAIISRSPNQSRSSERAVPIHMLQDVYIPLTRIDAGVHGNIEVDAERNDDLEDSTEDLGLEDDTEQLSEVEEFEAIPRLDVVAEDIETEEDTLISSRSRIDDGLEGPSWLLGPPPEARASTSNLRLKEEPDSTTGVQEAERELSPSARTRNSEEMCAFSPTVRRRKRAGSPVPPATPRPNRRSSVNERVLKVMVTKMRLSGEGVGVGEGEGGGASQRSPPKRPKPDRLMSFDAPSPSGTTDSRVIVLDTSEIQPDITSPVSHITVRGQSSRREKQHDRHKHNKHACRSDHDEHADQSEWNNKTEQLEQNDTEDQGDRSEANLPQDQNKFSAQNKFKSLSRKERHKRRELSRIKQNEYAGQSDQYNRGDPIEDPSRSVKCERTDRHEQRDRSVNSHEERDGNVSREQRDRSVRRERSVNREQRDRSVSRERSVNREQRDRSVSRDRSNRHERRGRSDRREQNDSERNDRGEHVDRSNHNEHSQQNGERDRYESNEYRARSDLSERNDRHDRSNERSITRRDRSDQTRHSSRDSDSESISESITEGRSRRIRKTVTYKEKPLNRKMRR